MSTPTDDEIRSWMQPARDAYLNRGGENDLSQHFAAQVVVLLNVREALLARATQAEQERDRFERLWNLESQRAEKAEADAFQARNGRIKAEQERDAWVVLHDLVKAERDRLRTALEQIAEEHTTEPQAGCEWCEAVIGPCPTVVIARAASGSTTEPRQAALTMAVVEEAAYATAAVYVDGDGESAAWMVRDLIVLAGSTTEPEEDAE